MSLFDTGIRPAVDAYLKAKGDEERNYGDYWSASSAGYCMRLNIMKRLKVPEVSEIAEDKARSTRVFESGHIFHEWMQRITKDAGLSIASEVELQDEELMIRGHFDDLILVDNNLILYDYKTAHSQSFKWKKQQETIGHYHKMQLGTYMYMLRGLKGAYGKLADIGVEPQLADSIVSSKDGVLLKEARILSISKDDLRMDEKQLIWSPELEKEVVDYWTTLNRYWKERKMPPCTCTEHDGGFMGKRSAKGKVYNPFFYNNQPCSLEWYSLNKKEGNTDGGN